MAAMPFLNCSMGRKRLPGRGRQRISQFVQGGIPVHHEGEGRVQIYSCDPSARPRHLAPDFLARPVDHCLEVVKVILIKASEEVAVCGGIWNSAGSEQMLDSISVLEIGDVFNAVSADVLVIDMREDVVRLAVGYVDCEQSDRAVDVPIELQTHGQMVSEGDAAVGSDLAPLLDVDSNLTVGEDGTDALRPEQGLVLVSPDLFGFGSLADTFGSCRIVHLKGLLATRWLLSPQPQYIAS